MKKWLASMIIVILAISTAACGLKSKEDVVTALNKKVENMKGYKLNAVLSVTNNDDPQTYDVEIWHSKPTYYKVSLKNAKRNQHQMIIRNDDGVFVLTPALNKSFKFQSEWPMNSSQAYLYESLVRDIVKDNDAVFEANEEEFIFTTKTNYQNSAMLPKQKVVFSKDLEPKTLEIFDKNDTAIVKVVFSNMKFDETFTKEDFNTDKSMGDAKKDVPTMSTTESPFTIVYPSFVPDNTMKSYEKEMQTEDGSRTIIQYAGKVPFTLIQERATVLPSSATVYTAGEPIDLGVTIGTLTEKTIAWTYQGVDYWISSEKMTQKQLVEVASSMVYVEGK
ncbi:MAG: LolA family protein [Bacilli bacterium]